MNPETPYFVSLSNLGLLQLQGPDTNKFLQGQTINDVNHCTPESWQHNAHCTPKGRMVANFDSVRVDDQTLLLRLPKDTQAALQAALGKYIVFSKAKLTDANDTYTLIGIYGPTAANWLQQHLNITFANEQTVAQNDHGLFLKLDEQRIECWLPATQQHPAFSQIEVRNDVSPWQLLDIQQGRGWVCASTVEEFLPQLLNLQAPAINAINFKKGCYTGQEIVARMHYKGKLKRHMYLLAADGSHPATAGADVYRKDKLRDDVAQSVGTVVNAVVQDERTWLLAVITADDVDCGKLSLSQESPVTLELLQQPYSVG